MTIKNRIKESPNVITIHLKTYQFYLCTAKQNVSKDSDNANFFFQFRD